MSFSRGRAGSSTNACFAGALTCIAAFFSVRVGFCSDWRPISWDSSASRRLAAAGSDEAMTDTSAVAIGGSVVEGQRIIGHQARTDMSAVVVGNSEMLADMSAMAGRTSDVKNTTARDMLGAESPAAALARNPDLMCDTYGYSPAPLYLIAVKGFSNFAVGLLLLLGVSTLCQKCLHLCFAECGRPKWRNAYTGLEVEEEAGEREPLNSAARADGEINAAPREGDGILSADGDLLVCHLRPGHRVIAFGQEGKVSQVSLKDGTEDLDAGAGIVIDCVHGGGYWLAPSRVIGMFPPVPGYADKPYEDLIHVKYTSTLSSTFLSPFTVKPLTVLFQMAGIFTSGYASLRLFLTIPIESWPDWHVFGLMLCNHSCVMTLLVAMSQTLCVAMFAETAFDQRVGYLLFFLSVAVAAPLGVVMLTTGMLGFIVFLLPALPLGILMVSIVGLALSYLDIVRDETVISSYEQKSRLGKAIFVILHYLPGDATKNKSRMFLAVAYIIVATPGIPMWWLILAGYEHGWQVAAAFLVEVSLPLLALVLLTVFIPAMLNISNFRYSGVVMVCAFVVAHLSISLISLLVPASVLMQESSASPGEALSMAFQARQGAVFLRCSIAGFQRHLLDAGVFMPSANSTLQQADLALSQIMSILS